MASIPLLQCFSLQKDEIFMELLGSFSHESLHKENETTVAIKWIQVLTLAGMISLEELVVIL